MVSVAGSPVVRSGSVSPCHGRVIFKGGCVAVRSFLSVSLDFRFSHCPRPMLLLNFLVMVVLLEKVIKRQPVANKYEKSRGCRGSQVNADRRTNSRGR